MNKLILIDADSLAYHACKETLQDSIESLNDRISNMFTKTDADFAAFFVSDKITFRHKIAPFYKGNRLKTPTTLKWIKSLTAYLSDAYGVNSFSQVEADDLVNYWYNQAVYAYVDKVYPEMQASLLGKELKEEDKVTKIICSPDKDLLKCIPGTHFNYSYKSEEEKGWWVETTVEEAYDNFWKSMITGDPADNIKGIEGKGIKFAEKLIKSCNELGIMYPSAVFNQYVIKYNDYEGIIRFQQNYRLLKLLENDLEFYNEIGTIPNQTLKIITINKE